MTTVSKIESEAPTAVELFTRQTSARTDDSNNDRCKKLEQAVSSAVSKAKMRHVSPHLEASKLLKEGGANEGQEERAFWSPQERAAKSFALSNARKLSQTKEIRRGQSFEEKAAAVAAVKAAKARANEPTAICYVGKKSRKFIWSQVICRFSQLLPVK